MKVQLLAFLLMIIVIGGCRFTVDPTTAPEMNEPVAQFVDDVNQGRMNEAWKLLAADEQAKLDRSQFVAAGNDFKRVSADRDAKQAELSGLIATVTFEILGE